MGHCFKVHYKRGSQNTVVGAISRLRTHRECPFDPNFDVPYLRVEIAEAPNPSAVGTVYDDHEWIEDLEGVQTIYGHITWPAHVAEEVTNPMPIPMEE